MVCILFIKLRETDSSRGQLAKYKTEARFMDWSAERRDRVPDAPNLTSFVVEPLSESVPNGSITGRFGLWIDYR